MAFGKFNALAAVALAGVMTATGAAATPVTTVFTNQGTTSGQDCGGPNAVIGAFGDGTCQIGGSPHIIKFNFSGTTASFEELNSALFPSIDGTEFSFFFIGGSNDGSGGTWTYTPGVGDPIITAFTVKGSDSFNTYTRNPGETSNFQIGFSTPVNNGGQSAALSHLIFFDSETTTPIPLPAAAWLLLGGLGALGVASRKRKAA